MDEKPIMVREKIEKKKLLSFSSVTVGYNGNAILKDINLTIYQQDFLGIIGANGSGKTTLIRVLLGLIKPFRGSVHFYFAKGENARKKIGYLPQQSMIDKKFPITVYDVVLSGLTSKVGLFRQFSKTDKDSANEILDKMGILNIKKRSIGTLSGGQMQRVFLARALVSSPALLILDEPDTFIDKSFTEVFYEILEDLNKKMAILLVSHDIGMISSHVKSIACLNIEGNLFYHDSNKLTQSVLDSYKCPIDLITHGDLPHRVLDKHQR